MALMLTTPPTLPVATLYEAKAQMRVDAEDEDALIERLVATATAHLEGRAGITGRAFAPQVWTWSGAIPCTGRLVLPLAPVITVASVPAAGAAVDAGDYALSEPDNGEMVFAARWRGAEAVVAFEAGYADAAIPEPLKHAVLLLASLWFEHRAELAEPEGATRMIPYGVRALVAPFRRVSP